LAQALNFVINYEEGGENCILHGDPSSEHLLSEIVGAAPLKGQRHINMETLYEYAIPLISDQPIVGPLPGVFLAPVTPLPGVL